MGNKLKLDEILASIKRNINPKDNLWARRKMPQPQKNWKAQLRKFHNWLKRNDDYVAMLSHGSIATGDPWIPGLSDYDIIIVYKKDALDNFVEAKAYLQAVKFSDHYHFFPLTEQQIKSAGGGTFAFSNSFRTKVLFGEDVLSDQHVPERKAALETYKRGIENEKAQLQIYLVNTHKTLKKTRKEFWRRFKHIFMLLAIKLYAETGEYPKNRKEVVRKLNAPPELMEAWDVLHHINEKNKKEILGAAQRLLDYIKEHH